MIAVGKACGGLPDFGEADRLYQGATGSLEVCQTMCALEPKCVALDFFTNGYNELAPSLTSCSTYSKACTTSQARAPLGAVANATETVSSYKFVQFPSEPKTPQAQAVHRSLWHQPLPPGCRIVKSRGLAVGTHSPICRAVLPLALLSSSPSSRTPFLSFRLSLSQALQILARGLAAAAPILKGTQPCPPPHTYPALRGSMGEAML